MIKYDFILVFPMEKVKQIIANHTNLRPKKNNPKQCLGLLSFHTITILFAH